MLKQFKANQQPGSNIGSASAVAKPHHNPVKEEVKKPVPNQQNFYSREPVHGNNSEEDDDIKEDIVEEITGLDDNQIAQGR